MNKTLKEHLEEFDENFEDKVSETPVLDGLEDYLKGLNLMFNLDFLYSVYEDQEMNVHMIFYHGKFSGGGNKNTVSLNLEEIPLDRIKNLAERTMIKRYCEEYHHGRFGIYQGNETEGTVKKVLWTRWKIGDE